MTKHVIEKHPQVARKMQQMHSEDAKKWRKQMRILTSANKLAQIGVDFLIGPDNTIHKALPCVQSRSPMSWLHIAEVVATQAVELGFSLLGLIGTRWLVDGDVYPQKLKARGLT